MIILLSLDKNIGSIGPLNLKNNDPYAAIKILMTSKPTNRNLRAFNLVFSPISLPPPKMLKK